MGSRFFGLTPQYRISLFTQIHEIVFHSNGGYDWHTIYNMPIWLRNFTFNKLHEHYNKVNNVENEDTVKKSITAMKSAGATRDKSPSTKISPPTYVTKALKK